MRKVNVGIVQLSCDVDPDRNFESAVSEISRAARQGANIVCLPELFRTRYPCQSEDHCWFARAEPVPGPSCARLAELAAHWEVVILASLFEKRAAGIYHNTVAVLDADGKHFEIRTLPATPTCPAAGRVLPASYANFYMANELILVPVFGHNHDEQACGVLRELWPSREVIPIDCRDMVVGLGAIHCLTQQVPAV